MGKQPIVFRMQLAFDQHLLRYGQRPRYLRMHPADVEEYVAWLGGRRLVRKTAAATKGRARWCRFNGLPIRGDLRVFRGTIEVGAWNFTKRDA